VSDDIAVMKR